MTMMALWKKRNLKGHDPLAVIDPPESFQPLVEELDPTRVVRSLEGDLRPELLIAFVTERS